MIVVESKRGYKQANVLDLVLQEDSAIIMVEDQLFEAPLGKKPSLLTIASTSR